MKGWKIFAHSLRMLGSNMRPALQVALFGFTITGVLVIASYYSVLVGASQFLVNLYPFEVVMRGSVTLNFFLLLLLYAFISIWVAVAWHRFVLLSEYPDSWLPHFHWRAFLGYFKPLFILFMIAMFVYLPMLFRLAISLNGAGPIMQLLPLIVITLTLLFLLRLSVILPAAAVERPLSIAEAWRSTKGSTASLAFVLIMMGVAQTVISGGIKAFVGVSPLLAAIFFLAYSIFFGLLKISILTTLYGHYIEGRALR